jgi:branched-chain amino acid transport system substrate-binding protein
MKKLLCGLAGLAAVCSVAGSPALAQDTIKIGIINSYSGQFADTGIQLDNGIRAAPSPPLLARRSLSAASIPQRSR